MVVAIGTPDNLVVLYPGLPLGLSVNDRASWGGGLFNSLGTSSLPLLGA